jgi:hypothetical protein
MKAFCGMVAVSVLCLSMLFSVGGCAVFRSALSDNATTADTQAALCQDAMLGLEIWSAMQEGSTPEAKAYWQAYKVGVDIAVKAYCAGS